MFKSIFVWLQIIFAVVSSQMVDFSKEFIHIGTFKSAGTRVRRSTGNFDENDYYMSIAPTTWSTAQADCKYNYGANATMISIESEEEWEFLKETLESYGGTTYWTSGMYDFSAATWKWSTNNHQLLPFAPWDNGYPKTPQPILRVLVYHTNRYNAFWHTVANSQLHRYICEVNNISQNIPVTEGITTTDTFSVTDTIQNTVPVPCYKTNDLVVVLDSSGSITTKHYETAKAFVEKLAAAFTAHLSSRLAFIVYSSHAAEIFKLNNTLGSAAISSTILSTPYLSMGTSTWLGVNLAIDQFNYFPRPVPLNMVVLTDGQSSSLSLTAESAALAKSMGIRLFSVGITSNVNNQELLTLAGGEPSRVYFSANFDELVNLLAPLSLHICSSN